MEEMPQVPVSQENEKALAERLVPGTLRRLVKSNVPVPKEPEPKPTLLKMLKPTMPQLLALVLLLSLQAALN